MSNYFIDSLNEHTSGGFIYVRINEDGEVEIYQKFDNEVCHLAAWSKLKKYIELAERVDEEIGIENLIANMSTGSDDEDGDEEGYIDSDSDEDDQ